MSCRLQVPIGGEEAANEIAVVGAPRKFDFEIRLVVHAEGCFAMVHNSPHPYSILDTDLNLLVPLSQELHSMQRLE